MLVAIGSYRQVHQLFGMDVSQVWDGAVVVGVVLCLKVWHIQDSS